MSARQDLVRHRRRLRGAVLSVLMALALKASMSSGATVLLEAEQFAEPGGWVTDQQFMDQMGSPYLLAHGLGCPVADAVTTVALPTAGAWHVYVRTYDWVAPWSAPGAPGRFELLVDGRPLPVTFGTEGASWHWQYGGQTKIGAGKATTEIRLHDLTGFEGRCDAVCLSTERLPLPPNAADELAAWRRKLLALPEEPEALGPYDLVVAGGGIAGTCAALSAARLGLSVALVQDRPVLGGNNSSEVRVWLQGAPNGARYPGVGGVVAELEQARKAHYGPANTAAIYEDERKLAIVRAETNITLLLSHRVNGVERHGPTIAAALAQDVRSGRRKRVRGRWFVDATGDACLGFLAGADWELTPTGHMGRCNLWNVADTGQPVTFPRCPWALDLTDKPFPGRGGHGGIEKLGGWYWESGFDHDPFEKSEYIRDWNFRAMYGAWDCLKNVDRVYPTYALNWAAYVSGKRESRRLLGDLVLTKDDLLDEKDYPDGCVATGWNIDLHLPEPRYVKGFEGDAFISKAHFTKYPMPYYVPYRCLYSRNVANLFMAGRCVSVTHGALGATRVMRTGGLMGEVVGMAAAVCRRCDTTPRGVYTEHFDALKELMLRGVGKAVPTRPGAPAHAASVDASRTRVAHLGAVPEPPAWLAQAGTNLALTARVTVSGSRDATVFPPALLTDGQADYRDNGGRWLSDGRLPTTIEFAWDRPRRVAAARVVSGYRGGDGRVTAPLVDFVVQYHDGRDWQDVAPARINGNTLCDWGLRFDPVVTDRMRIRVTATPGDIARIWEIGLYAPGGRQP